MKLNEIAPTHGSRKEALPHRPRHRLGRRQDRRPRRQGPDRAFRRAHQGLRGRPDAAASPAAQARLQQHHVRPAAERGEPRQGAGGDRRQACSSRRAVDAAALVKAGLMRRAKDGVRLLGNGELKAKVEFRGVRGLQVGAWRRSKRPAVRSKSWHRSVKRAKRPPDRLYVRALISQVGAHASKGALMVSQRNNWRPISTSRRWPRPRS